MDRTQQGIRDLLNVGSLVGNKDKGGKWLIKGSDIKVFLDPPSEPKA
jgi:hypothetical protein